MVDHRRPPYRPKIPMRLSFSLPPRIFLPHDLPEFISGSSATGMFTELDGYWGTSDRAIIRNIIEVETCRPLRKEDTQQETLKGDDYPIEYGSDGYPELPACLDRCRPRLQRAA
jgi:hypothetical protein